jgi:YfiH family protein
MRDSKKGGVLRLAKKGQVEYLEAAEVVGLDCVTHAFCTRHAGVSAGGFASLNTGDAVGDRQENVAKNLNIIKDVFAIFENSLVMARQVHGDRIVEIGDDSLLPLLYPECDGFVTARPGVALGIKTADCVPILFVDPRRRVAGALHAGWRGAAQGIAEKMVAIFRNRFFSHASDIVAMVGPAVGACCYEVDAPVFDAFARAEGMQRCFNRLDGKERWMFDLALANRLQLIEAGISEENIITADTCTACRRDLLFSHRAAQGAKEGRQLSFIMLNKKA